MFLVSLVTVVAALIVIVVAVVLAETTLVYIAFGLAGVSAVVLTIEMVRHRVELGSAFLSRQGTSTQVGYGSPRTDGLGKASVPAAAVAASPVTHSGNSARVPASADMPVRGSVSPGWTEPATSVTPPDLATGAPGHSGEATGDGDSGLVDAGSAADDIPDTPAGDTGAEDLAADEEAPKAKSVPVSEVSIATWSDDGGATIPGEAEDATVDADTGAVVPDESAERAAVEESLANHEQPQPVGETEATTSASVDDGSDTDGPEAARAEDAPSGEEPVGDTEDSADEDMAGGETFAGDTPDKSTTFSAFVERLQWGSVAVSAEEPTDEDTPEVRSAGGLDTGCEEVATEITADDTADNEPVDAGGSAEAAGTSPHSDVTEYREPETPAEREPHPDSDPTDPGPIEPTGELAEPERCTGDDGSVEVGEDTSGNAPAEEDAATDPEPVASDWEPADTEPGGSEITDERPTGAQDGESTGVAPAVDTDEVAVATSTDVAAEHSDAHASGSGTTAESGAAESDGSAASGGGHPDSADSSPTLRGTT